VALISAWADEVACIAVTEYVYYCCVLANCSIALAIVYFKKFKKFKA